MIARGELKPGIELLQTALPRLHADRYELYASAFVAELSGGLAGLGQLREGLQILHEAIARVESLDLNPPSAEQHHLRAWYVLGDLLERRGRFTVALNFFEAVSAADAESTDAPERARRLKKKQ